MPPLYWKEMDRASKQEKSTGGSKDSLWKIFSEETSDMDKDISLEYAEDTATVGIKDFRIQYVFYTLEKLAVWIR